jgi:hypothetical protein
MDVRAGSQRGLQLAEAATLSTPRSGRFVTQRPSTPLAQPYLVSARNLPPRQRITPAARRHAALVAVGARAREPVR